MAVFDPPCGFPVVPAWIVLLLLLCRRPVNRGATVPVPTAAVRVPWVRLTRDGATGGVLVIPLLLAKREFFICGRPERGIEKEFVWSECACGNNCVFAVLLFLTTY